MRTAILGVATLLVSASFQPACSLAPEGERREQYTLGEDFAEMTSRAELEGEINELLTAHSKCTFSAQLRDRTPEPPAPWAQIDQEPKAHCLGALTVSRAQRENETLVSIELNQEPSERPPGQVAETYVVFARFLDGGWQLSWPTPLGPDLHPAPSP